MTRTLRVGLILATVAAIAAAGAGGVSADAGTVGGKLSVTPTLIIVVNTASLAQSVDLSADPDDGTAFDPPTVDLAPGESVRVDVTGPATGDAVARFSAAGISGEAVGVVLRAPFRPDVAPPASPWLGAALWAVLAALGGLVILYGVRRRVLARERGQGLAEYALLLALIAIVAIVALIFLGSQVSGILSSVGSSV